MDAQTVEAFTREWWVDILLGKPLTITLVLAVAFLARWLVNRAIDNFVIGLGRTGATGPWWRRRDEEELTPTASLATARRAQRAETIGQLLKSVAAFGIGAVAGVMILDVLGLPVAPLLASAGIVGAALGFGAQNLVKDFLSGVFMLVEDQYGVGDVIDMGEAAGTVETVGLRVTSLRDANGTLWYVRNGEVLRVGNKSQGWARAIVDVSVAADEDIPKVRALLLTTVTRLADEPAWSARIVDQPEVPGVEALTRDAAVLRVLAKTLPGEQWAVQREIRERVSQALSENGVRLPPPVVVPPLA